MKNYDHKKIEKKWQEVWEKNEVTQIDKDDTSKEKYYALDMFPYPSGDGMHMGHTKVYIASDIYARHKKAQGFNVLHPQGADSFGLPAENYAIKTKAHPKETTTKNIENYIRQWKMLGVNHDLDNFMTTSTPEYYKWTQWLFAELYKNDYAYKKTSFTNWCDSCKTILANEQVENGACERCKSEVVQKEVPGWFFKTTDFADELIDGLDKVDWPEHTKVNQENWIGKSEGAEIEFEVVIKKENKKISNVVMIHGCPGDKEKSMNEDTRTYDKHWLPWVREKLQEKDVQVDFPLMPHPWQPSYEEHKKEFKKIGIDENSVLVGTSCGASFLLRYLGETKQKIKKLILVAPWYEPSLDEKECIDFYNFEIDSSITERVDEITIFTSDNEHKTGLETVKLLKEKFNPKIICIDGYGHYLERDMGIVEFPKLIREVLSDKKISVFTTRPDTLFGCTYCVLAPEHSLVQKLKEQIENYDEVTKYIKEVGKKTELERMEGKDKTGVELKGVKAINPANNEEIPIFIADYVLAGYGTGAIMAVPAHDERDFEFAEKFDLLIHKVIVPPSVLSIVRNANDLAVGAEDELRIKGKCWSGLGKLTNSEKFNGMDSEEAKKAITEFVGGEMTNTYRLRDWSISRQRYWGAPIPIVYSPEGEAKFVGEENLPWMLPEDVDFVPTGVAPLSNSKELFKRTEKLFGKGWTPEVDTMDTFVCSSWYYLRYPDTNNDKEFCSEKRLKHWLPVDTYIGGAEHTYMHLLYARFITKALNKIGILNFDEPFLKLRHQGMVLDSKGVKMSKSKGNVVNPDEMVEKYGADAVRMYMMFAGPLEDDVMWQEDNIVGIYRFLEKVWKLNEKVSEGVDEKNIEIILNQTIKKVGEDIESLKFNTAISQMMKFINKIEKEKNIPHSTFCILLKLLAPFAPHITEELWAEIGNKITIHNEKWPEYDENKTKDTNVIIAVQINGKVRATFEVEAKTEDEIVKKMAQELESVKKWTDTKEIKKVIYVPNKLVSIVTN